MPSDSSFESLRPSQNAANSKPGPRTVPSREIPVPTTVSPQLREFIAAPYRAPVWDANPQTSAEWKKLISGRAKEVVQEIQTISKQMGVTVTPEKMEGVPIFRVRPHEVAPANRNRLLMNIHGGGYVFNPGEAATLESVLMAGIGKFEIVCVDYRMPPDHPFPAGLDDSFRVWKSLCSCHDPRKLGLFGTSAGAGLAAATVLRTI
ncbi:MAG: alpha/beta hydrolase, partial [Verrucomicrobia bacterium]|nr:alpha/beta hydrolase [Verrucomicrobiota bacterium]